MGYAQTSLFVENWHGDMNIVDQEICLGDVYFVDSASANAGNSIHHGRSREKPFSTLAYAVTQTTTGQGDWIVVGPNHAETVAGAGGIAIAAAMDNLTIIGVVGHGGAMPTITFAGAVGGDIEIDGANTKFKNIRFFNTEDGSTGPLDVDAEGCIFENCIFEDDGADNTVVWILADANADYLKVINCRNFGTDTAGNTAWISIAGADHVRIEDCVSHGDFSSGNILCTAAVTDIVVRNCWLETHNAAGVNVQGFAASTGFMADCCCVAFQDADVIWANTNASIGLFENYGVNDITNGTGESGRIVGTRSV